MTLPEELWLTEKFDLSMIENHIQSSLFSFDPFSTRGSAFAFPFAGVAFILSTAHVSS